MSNYHSSFQFAGNHHTDVAPSVSYPAHTTVTNTQSLPAPYSDYDGFSNPDASPYTGYDQHPGENGSKEDHLDYSRKTVQSQGETKRGFWSDFLHSLITPNQVSFEHLT